jgi:hypothetical protein
VSPPGQPCIKAPCYTHHAAAPGPYVSAIEPLALQVLGQLWVLHVALTRTQLLQPGLVLLYRLCVRQLLKRGEEAFLAATQTQGYKNNKTAQLGLDRRRSACRIVRAMYEQGELGPT